MRKLIQKRIPEFEETKMSIFKRYPILTWVVAIFVIFAAIVAVLANLRTAFPPDSQNIESTDPSHESKAMVGYYTDWIYTGTETSRNLPVNNMLTQYSYRSVDTRIEGNTTYSLYTYDIYMRLYIGSNPSEFIYLESNPDEVANDKDKWVYAGAVTIVGELLYSDENIRYTLLNSNDVLVEDPIDGSLSYETQRTYDIAIREGSIEELYGN